MRIQAFGLSHKTAPIEIREKISFPAKRLHKALSSLSRYDSIQECLILSTCNRVEIYIAADSLQESALSVQRFLSDFHRVEPEILQRHFYLYNNARMIEHLFRVVSSLDSMVVGETQVLGQVKEAYFQAQAAKTAGKILSPVFEEAIKVGKRVRSQTHIGKGAVSVSSASIELAKKVFKDLKDKMVLIIGAGKIAELAVENLYAKGVKTVIVANRTFAKAKELAGVFEGKAINFEDIAGYLQNTDILISSTSAPHFVLKEKQIQEAAGQRNCKPLLIIDLGLPRNIPPEAGRIKDVHLYNLDDLSEVCQANLKGRLCEAKKAENIIARHLELLTNRLTSPVSPRQAGQDGAGANSNSQLSAGKELAPACR